MTAMNRGDQGKGSDYRDAGSPTTSYPTTEKIILRPPADPNDPASMVSILASRPARSHHSEVIRAMMGTGDQPKSAEVDLANGVTMSVGVKQIYFNVGGLVAMVPCTLFDENVHNAAGETR